MDHFERLGLPRSARIDATRLERHFLEKSREVHPDLNADEEEAMVAAAALNEAHRVLGDPWQRYEYLAELLEPGVMDATKQLCPTFLAEAMDLFEEAHEARGSAEACSALASRVTNELDEFAQQSEDLLESADGARSAAVLCHQARYLHRALETLTMSDLPA